MIRKKRQKENKEVEQREINRQGKRVTKGKGRLKDIYREEKKTMREREKRKIKREKEKVKESEKE